MAAVTGLIVADDVNFDGLTPRVSVNGLTSSTNSQDYDTANVVGGDISVLAQQALNNGDGELVVQVWYVEVALPTLP